MPPEAMVKTLAIIGHGALLVAYLLELWLHR